ncbi:MAG: Crp/Fnr family transcriptional regulator [Bacteroidota bacterium]
MRKEDIIEALEKNYIKLSDSCINSLLDVSKILNAQNGEKIVKEGQYADKAYFIIKGCARAFYLKDGKDITDWFAFDNDFICSINSFYLDIPSPHYIEVLEPTVLLEISKKHIDILSTKYPEFDKLEKLVVIKTMLRLQQRIVSVQFETAAQKYINLLNIRPDITQRVSLTYIASYLGITLETLSRIRKERI